MEWYLVSLDIAALFVKINGSPSPHINVVISEPNHNIFQKPHEYSAMASTPARFLDNNVGCRDGRSGAVVNTFGDSYMSNNGGASSIGLGIDEKNKATRKLVYFFFGGDFELVVLDTATAWPLRVEQWRNRWKVRGVCCRDDKGIALPVIYCWHIMLFIAAIWRAGILNEMLRIQVYLNLTAQSLVPIGYHYNTNIISSWSIIAHLTLFVFSSSFRFLWFLFDIDIVALDRGGCDMGMMVRVSCSYMLYRADRGSNHSIALIYCRYISSSGTIEHLPVV